MRLISCHIENFGRLSGFDFDFAEGCNAINEDNGWGKSTFATFLKVMFFGFSGEGKRNDLENERKHFAPWQGGVYGGSIVFAVGDKRYKLIRNFGAKVSEDFFELRDAVTNLVSEDYDESIGKTIFQVDGESFIRTAYITQSDIKIEMNAEISAKMGGLAGLSDDLASYDRADDKLDGWLRANTKRRKTGRLSVLEEEIAALRHELSRVDDLDRSIDELNQKKKAEIENRDELMAAQEALVAEQKLASEIKAAKQIKAQYEEICAQVQERQALEESARKRFPGELPLQSELEKILDEANQLDVKAGKVAQYRLTESDADRLVDLGRVFEAAGEPDVALLEQYTEEISNNVSKKIELAQNGLNPVDEETYVRYREVYGDAANCAQCEQEIIDLENRWGERAKANDDLKQSEQIAADCQEKYEAAVAEIEAGKKSIFGVRPLPIILILLGIGLAAIGFVIGGVMLPVLGAVGGIVLLVGIIFLLLPMMYKGKTDALRQNAEQLREKLDDVVGQRETLSATVENYDCVAAAFLSRYGETYNEYTFLSLLAGKKSEIREYRNLIGKKEKADSTKEQLKVIEDAEQVIRDYVSQFLPVGTNDLRGDVLKVKEMFREYRALKEQKVQHEAAEKEYKAALLQVQTYVRGLEMQPEEDLVLELNTVRDNLIAYNTAHSEALDAASRKNKFETEHPDWQKAIETQEPENLRSLEEINEQLTALPGEINRISGVITDYDVQINDLVEARMQISEKENQLAIKQEEFDSLQTMYGLVDKAKNLLQEAKETFTAKYIGPTQDAFGKYYAVVEASKADRYHFDANMNITAEEAGRDREIGFLSRGYQDLVGVCYRLAVLDAMYATEKPLIILDDPFVNLDETKFAGAMELLKMVSTEYQVVYFTCRKG